MISGKDATNEMVPSVTDVQLVVKTDTRSHYQMVAVAAEAAGTHSRLNLCPRHGMRGGGVSFIAMNVEWEPGGVAEARLGPYTISMT